MGPRIELKGRYKFANQKKPEERAANKQDPRHVFYEAMLRHSTFEAYDADVGDQVVVNKGQRRYVTGRAEMSYAARERGWVVGVDMIVPRWRRGQRRPSASGG